MCSVGDLDSSVTRSRIRVSLAAFFLAVVVSLASIGTVQAESGALGHLGLRLGGMIVGGLAWRLEKCGESESANAVLAAVAQAPGRSAEEVAAILEGVDHGGKRAAEAAEQRKFTFSEEECNEWMDQLTHAGSKLTEREGTSEPLMVSSEVERFTHDGCADITEDGARLACHDRVAAAGATLKEGEMAYGAWNGSSRNSYDGKLVVLRQRAEGHFIGADVTRPVDVFIRCRDGKTSMWLDYGEDFGNIEEATILIDGTSVQKLRMSASLMGGAAFWPDRREPLIPFLKRLAASGARVLSFATQVIPVGERRTVPPVSEVSVRLDGLREGLKPIAQACYWR